MREHGFVTKDSVVIVTGAGGGIGSATALKLASLGMTVVTVDKNESQLSATTKRIADAGFKSVAIAADVTSEDDCKKVCNAASTLGLPLKGLVNNAAVGAFNMSVEQTSLDEWNRIIAINLTSLFLMSKYALPHIRKAGGGAIVNVSSVHAYATSTGVAPYAAAKGGVLALTRTMALDLAKDKIRVICLAPGAVNTPMLQQHADREGKTLAELGFPAGSSDIARIADPAELADTISFALSKEATFITGSAIVADGGLLAKF